MLFGLEALNVPLDLSYFISLLVPTIIGAIALIMAIEILHERPHPARAFFVAFLANYLGPSIVSFFEPQFFFLPFGLFVIDILFWIVLIKLFFREISLYHSVGVGILCYIIKFVLIWIGLSSLIRTLLTGIIPGVS